MKKLLSMMLMICAFVTFTACSSDDGPQGDQCPLSDVVVPTSMKIGSEVTVQGKGFTSSQKFYLSVKDGAYPVELTDVKVSASGVTFTVPYTVVEDKTFVFSVLDGEKEWKYGSITILAADSPVSAVSIPSQIALMSNATITGTGFVDGDKIGIKNDQVDDIIYFDAKPVDGGVTIDATIALEGDVDVYLRRGYSEWKIGTTYTYLPRVISSITVSDNYFLNQCAGMLELEGSELKLDMQYDKDYALQSVKTNSNAGLEWDFTYSGNTVSFTGQFSGAPYTYTLDDNKRIVSSTAYDMYGDEVTYTWHYDADGYLVSITSSDKSDVLSATYADNNLQAYNFQFDYGTDTQNTVKAYPATVEPVYLLNSFSWIFQKEDLFFGFLLNQNVKISSSILGTFNVGETGKSFDVASDLKFDDTTGVSTLTLSTSSEDGVVDEYAGIYSNKVTVVYNVKSQE